MNLKHWNRSHYTQLDLFTESALFHAQKVKVKTHTTKMQSTSSQSFPLHETVQTNRVLTDRGMWAMFPSLGLNVKKRLTDEGCFKG